ncbi:hypothetical protein SH449x_004910 [Pirellulaceae bacterium SH449]
MSIDGLPVSNANVTGTWIPDFLWTGKAWTIVIETNEELELLLDGRVFLIPAGSHEIYSNHDQTNTGQFGNQEFWGYPNKIEIRQLDITNVGNQVKKYSNEKTR